MSSALPLTDADQLIVDYMEHYGLSVDPFLPGHWFFGGAGRQQILDQLQHMRHFGSGALLLVGAEGVGKSHLLTHCLDQVQQDTIVCNIEASVLLSPAHILALLFDSLPTGDDQCEDAETRLDYDQLQAQIFSALESLAEEQAVLLTVDDAQHLSDEALLTLLELQHTCEHNGLALRVLIVAEDAIIERLSRSPRQDTIGIPLELPALTELDIPHYLQFRLEKAGLSDELPYPPELMDEWGQMAEGNLHKVHQWAKQYLLDRALQDIKTAPSGRGLPLLHIAIVSTLLAVLLVAYLYRDSLGASSDIDRQPAIVGEVAVEPLDKDSNIAAPVGAGETKDQLVLTGNASKDVVKADVAVTVDEQVSEQANQHSAEQSRQALEEVGLVSVDSVPADSEPTSKAPADDVNAPEMPAVDQSASGAGVRESSRRQSAAQSVVGDEPKKISTEKQQSSKPTTTDWSAAETSLLSWSDSDYTLQVLGAASLPGVHRFIGSQSNQSDLRWYQVQRQGKPWYVVVAGRYSSRSAAKQAITQLPVTQRKAGPWPRSMAEVKQQIRDNRR